MFPFKNMVTLSPSLKLQLDSINLNHRDRNDRFRAIFNTLISTNPCLIFPKIFKDSYQLKALYRLINNKHVKQEKIINSYQTGLIEYSLSQDSKQAWYLIHDTMLVEFNSRQVDLGYTQTLKSNGFLLHHGLLLDGDYTPLGLLHQEVIFRERENFGKRVLHRTKTIEDKESNKWLEGLKIAAYFKDKTERPLINVMDREGDIGDVINKCIELGQCFVIRSRHNRSTLSLEAKWKTKNLAAYSLYNMLQNNTPSQVIKHTLRNKKGQQYEALCNLRYASFEFRGINGTINCVHLQEIEPNNCEDQPVEWFILSNMPIANENDAVKIIEIYSKRWAIEEFHKCYKTGCSIEERQFDSRTALTNVIALLAIVAVELLRNRYYSKTNPNMPLEKAIPNKDERALIKKLAKIHLKPIDLTLCKEDTILWWIILLGRMGGHQGIKNKGLPGWQTIWAGYNYYTQILNGYMLGRKDFMG